MNSGNIFCRLCAELKPINKQVNLQCDSEKRGEIIEKLARINCVIEFIDNKLPNSVCLDCICSLNKCFDFVVSIDHAQNVLNDLFYLQNVKHEVDSDDEFSLEDVGTNDVQIKTESDDNVFYEPKKVRTPNKITKSGSLDSIPLSQLKQTWANYNWLCTYCETLFPTIDELHTHSMAVHSSCNPYRCTDCKVRKECLEKFLIHVQRHRKHLKYSCFKCLKKFKTIPLARKHSKVHLSKEFSCPGCNNNFKNSDELKQHKDTYLKVKYLRDLPRTLIGKGLTCIDCSKTFKSRNSLNTHLLTHTERKREQICEVCGKCFFQKHNLACHMLMHTDDRPHKCQICKLGFKTSTQLRHHIGVHNNDKPFSCDQCGRCFRLLKQLKNHSIIHTDSLPYQCSHCEKRFRFKTILNNHVRLHTGVKPYSCEACQRDFSNWSNYNKHMKRKHNHDTSKKKHTPEGLYPIDPSTGEVVVHPETKQVLEWKRQMLQGRRPGRPVKPDQSSDPSVVKTEDIIYNSS